MRALLVVVFLAGVARADELPWEIGTPQEQQDRANAIFAEGNELFTRLAHAAALEKYKAAIALWDHPMIRFNMAVTLIRLDRILEAADELERALRYGDKPFTPDLYDQARDYQALIKRQLGYIRVTADAPGTKVLLDGKPWFDGPGSQTVRVTTGEHNVVAERRGFLTKTMTLVVSGGKTVDSRVELVPIESAFIVRYRHPRWAPWAVVGGGALVAGTGLIFTLVGRRDMDRFAERFVAACPKGCESDLSMHPELADELGSAELKGDVGTGLLITGGLIAAGGVVWVILNRPIRTLPEVNATASRDGASASIGWRF